MSAPPGSLAELVDAQASAFDTKPLYRFVDTGEEWTFAGLAGRAARVAHELRSGGVEAGERVGLLTDDRATFCAAFFGLQHLGAVPVPLGLGGHVGTPAWAALLADRAKRFGLSAIVTDASLADAIDLALGRGCARAVDDGRDGPRAPAGPPAPLAFVQPSSGTTGDPKGVMIPQASVLANLAAMREHFAIDPADAGLSWLPLFHDMGLIGTAISAVFTGGLLYHWPTESFLRSPGRWIELLQETQSTIAVAPPFALELVTRRWRRRAGTADLSRVRTLLVGAERIRPEVLDAFAETFAPLGLAPHAITPTYGLAEATLGVTAMPMDRPYRIVRDGRHAEVSCGVALPGIEVRIDAPDAEGRGEIVVRTPGALSGYLDDPEATAAALRGGWLHTGDAGRLTADGHLLVTGRLKEMINQGGRRIAASDYELAVQGVDGVLPDRVVAFGDLGQDGERVVLLAESRYRTERHDELVLALRRRLADAGLAADVVAIVPAGFIPRTTSGKLRRNAAHARWRAGDVPT